MLFLVMIYVAPLVIIAWIVCEYFYHRNIRIAIGIIALSTACGAAFLLGGVGPSNEVILYTQSMNRINTLIQKGEGENIQKAFIEAKQNGSTNEPFATKFLEELDQKINEAP